MTNLKLRLSVALCAVTVGPFLHAQALPGDVLPKPRSLQVQSASYRITGKETVVLRGVQSARLRQATLRTLLRLENTTGIPMARSISAGQSGTIVLDVATDGQAVQGLDEDESYSLSVSEAGIVLKAHTTVGALHGLETLIQLVRKQDGSYVIPFVTVDDSPRFRWRGLMIDCGRHFEPLDVLKRNIDAMAAVKLNVFHWHLTEDQGFRIESKLYPKLTELGSDGKFYTQDDARELVRYARDRGIRVVPEFEMPGHSAAWLVAYPELNSGTQPDGIRREFGVSDIALDPTRDETYRFIAAFLKEMAGIFPDQYVHIGGDETPAPDWKKNPRILAFMKAHGLKDNDALQAYFNTRILKILSGLNRRMVGWDEIFNPSLPKDVVVQSWRGEASLAKGAQQGYQGVLSAPYYLDGMQPARTPYLADPVPATTALTPEQQRLILGGEVCMWAEQLDERTIDSRIWPRTAAIAERFWSAQDVRDVNDMYRRLWPVSLELETLGLKHLSSEDAGLRSLAGSYDIDTLRTFAKAFEPVGFGERYQQQHTSQLTPLTSFVDAVVPDPPVKQQLADATDDLLKHSATATNDDELLRSFFERTGATVPAVQQLIKTNPRLAPMDTRAAQLQKLCTLGVEALDLLRAGKKASSAWLVNADSLLAETKKPSAIVRFTFQEPLEKLVQAVR